MFSSYLPFPLPLLPCICTADCWTVVGWVGVHMLSFPSPFLWGENGCRNSLDTKKGGGGKEGPDSAEAKKEEAGWWIRGGGEKCSRSRFPEKSRVEGEKK